MYRATKQLVRRSLETLGREVQHGGCRCRHESPINAGVPLDASVPKRFHVERLSTDKEVTKARGDAFYSVPPIDFCKVAHPVETGVAMNDET
jgi:hypothetical protein